MAVAGVERGQRVFTMLGSLPPKRSLDELLQLRHVQIEHFGDQAERKNVLALVLGRAADGFDRQARKSARRRDDNPSAIPASGSTWSES